MIAAFAAARACVTERVRNIGYLLWERLGDGDVEAVPADVEEGAAVIEAVVKAGEVVIDAVEGAEPQNKA
jgi:hypothetical protein